jgi:hypothetical protein
MYEVKNPEVWEKAFWLFFFIVMVALMRWC